MSGKWIQALTISGIAILALGGIILIWLLAHPNTYITTEASVVKSRVSEGVGEIELLVRFMVDGREVEHYTQPVKSAEVSGKVGDRIEISYNRARILGIEAWRIYAGSDVDAPIRTTQWLSISIAVLMILAGAAMLLVASRIGK